MEYAALACDFGLSRASHRGMVWVVLNAEGVHFSAMFLIRVFHSPFLVRWNSVNGFEKRRSLFREYILLKIRDEAGEIDVGLPIKAEKELLKYYKPATAAGVAPSEP